MVPIIPLKYHPHPPQSGGSLVPTEFSAPLSPGLSGARHRGGHRVQGLGGEKANLSRLIGLRRKCVWSSQIQEQPPSEKMDSSIYIYMYIYIYIYIICAILSVLGRPW